MAVKAGTNHYVLNPPPGGSYTRNRVVPKTTSQKQGGVT